MYFYTNELLEQRKHKIERSTHGDRGDWISLAKFIIVVVVFFGSVGLFFRHYNQVKQEIVELRAAWLELDRSNQELEHKAQNRYTELERQRSADISEQARRLGLRPTRNSQIVRDVQLVWRDGSLRQPQELVSK